MAQDSVTTTATPTRDQPDTPLVPEHHNAETTFEYRHLVATALGFDGGRYPSGLFKDILCRLHALLVAGEPQPSKTVGEYRADIAEELELGDVDRYRNQKRSRGFDRYKLVQIVAVLQTYTQADLNAVIEAESKPEPAD